MTEYGRIHTDGSRSGEQPVEAQQRALAIANTLLGIDRATLGELSHHELMMALVRIVPQHDAARQELSDFKQKVSDAVEKQAQTVWDIHCRCGTRHPISFNTLEQFIIKPKPDPLVAALEGVTFDHYPPNDAKTIRAALDALGFEIREKGQ